MSLESQKESRLQSLRTMRVAVTLLAPRGSGAGRLPRRGLRWLALPWLLLMMHPAHAGDSLRCGSRIVSLNALAAEVQAVCGPPSYIDRWEYQEPELARYVAVTQVWTYNFGSNQLLRLLQFRNGRLINVDTDGYGFSQLPSGQCAPSAIVDGMSKYRLLVTCGDPVDRRGGSALRPYQPRARIYGQQGYPLNDYATPVFREEWTYNFGSGARLRTAILENGRVVDVTDGDRGFDPG